MSPLQLTYNGVKLHELGVITIASQKTDYSPSEFPQKETRTVTVKIDCWEKDTGYNYDLLYANIHNAREALRVQNAMLVWISPGQYASGQTQLERPVTVVSHDIPEDPNSWGVYHQQITIVFRYELGNEPGNTLSAIVTGAAGVAVPVSLGQVTDWKDDYKASFYSEWKNIRRISTGAISCSGEIFIGLGETGATVDNRLAMLLSIKQQLDEQLLKGNYITLTYGKGDSVFFDREVRVEGFHCDVDQGPLVGKLKWQLSVFYTKFPEEDGYAGAQFTTTRSTDNETGRELMSLNGKIVAATEAIAMAKLSVVTTTMLSAYGFASSNQTKRELSKQWVNNEDTQEESETVDGTAVSGSAFFELDFNYTYDKKKSNVVSYTLSISDSDDLKSGLITRTYSGQVVASGADEAAAYNTAITQARALGDRKHSFRLSAVETRSDRKMASQGSMEFMRVDFSYSYQLKGSRIYLELSSSVSSDTYGESQERISGYIVAADMATAQTAYQTLVRSNYDGTNSGSVTGPASTFSTPNAPSLSAAGRIIRGESFDQRGEYVQTGAPWTDGQNGSATMPIRFDFSLSLYKPKDAGKYAIKYTVDITMDYVGLRQDSRVQGVFSGSPEIFAAIEAGSSNPLDTFLAAAGGSFGTLVSKNQNLDKELIGAATPATATTTSIKFNAAYVKAINLGSQIVKCSLRESVRYSGTRNIFQQVPSGKDIRQNCGITQGSRTISGSVTACTEAACLTWIQTQRGTNGIYSRWRGDAPTEVYEEPMSLDVDFEFIPLTTGTVGVRPGNTGGNMQAITMSFQWLQIIPNLPAPF